MNFLIVNLKNLEHLESFLFIGKKKLKTPSLDTLGNDFPMVQSKELIHELKQFLNLPMDTQILIDYVIELCIH